jgi:hypothetical protein
MACLPSKRAGVSAIVVVCALLTAPPTAAQDVVTLSFSGEITEVPAVPPAPFDGAAVGDPWTLTYTFDPTTFDIDPSDTAGNYRGAVVDLTLTIGNAGAAGSPGAALPDGHSSVIGVNLGTGYADYTVMAGLPAGNAWAQVALWDLTGTPFLSDALPLEIPAPYEVAFPDDRSFFLRLPGSTELYLRGIVGRTSIAVRPGAHTKVRADLAIRVDDVGDRHLDLLWGVAGEQAFSFGEFSCPGCNVMGVEPSPFKWRALDSAGAQPAVGAAVLTIDLEHPGGEVMGVEPSPFRVFLDCGDGCSGELDFSEATAAYPGPLGSLLLEGVRIVFDDGPTVALAGFDVYDAADKVVLGGTRFDRFIALAVDEHDVVGLLATSDDSDPGIAADGWLLCPGCEVMGVEPSPFKWLAVDEFSTPAADGIAVAGFSLDPRHEVVGVEPTPFRVVLSVDGAILGELDFGEVGGTFPGALGELFLGNLRLVLPDGSSLGFDGFESLDRDDRLTLVDAKVDLRVTERADLNERRVDLVANSRSYGVGGFGSGSITCPGCEVMGVEPSPFRWIVDPDQWTPANGEAVVSYISDLGSTRMGVEPTPFRYFVVDSAGLALGEVDFSVSEGVWGSFHLEGVDVRLADGSTIAVQGFETMFVLTVAIDVKPGCDTNTINLGSAGVIPVAILSSPSFDATTVDPATISLSGASVKLVGNGKRYLAQPEDVNGDGLDDLMCHVVTDELELEIGDSVVVLEASTYDGTAVTGQDFIRIVPD